MMNDNALELRVAHVGTCSYKPTWEATTGKQ